MAHRPPQDDRDGVHRPAAKPMTPLAFALRYLALGIGVVPQLPGQKRPAVLWKEFQFRLPTEAELENWFANKPDIGMAAVLGPVSGLFAIDVDGQDAHQELMRQLGDVPDAPRVFQRGNFMGLLNSSLP